MTPMQLTIAAALLVAMPAFGQTPGQRHDHGQPASPPAAEAPAEHQPGHGMMGHMGHGMMQGACPMGQDCAGMQSGMMGQGSRGMMQGGMPAPNVASAPAVDRIEGRLAFIKAELRITEAQSGVWQTFADAVRGNVTTMNAERQAMRGRVGADVSLPDRVLAQANAFAAHAEEMTKLKAALDPLYAALSPEQKKVADDIVFSPMGVPLGMM